MRLLRVVQKQSRTEPVWHIVVTLGLAIVFQLMLSDEVTFGFKYIVTGLEAVLLLVIIIPAISVAIKRIFAIGLIGIISSANLVSLGLVIHALVTGHSANGHQLLLSSVAIYLTNIIVFGLLYWELDDTKQDEPDFLFPQANLKLTNWKPTFFDYVYVSITNATAFSPTDTLPLTHRAKLLMTVQGVASLATVALVTARAVNILN